MEKLIQEVRGCSGDFLNLSYCGIGNEELRVVCEEIKHHTSIKVLWLQCNQISDLTPIGEMMKYNSSIENLSLGDNRISDITPLTEALRYNSSLKEIWIRDNQISDLTLLIEALSHNSSLERLSVSGNPVFAPNILKNVEDMLSINRYNYRKRSTSLFEMMLESGILRRFHTKPALYETILQ